MTVTAARGITAPYEPARRALQEALAARLRAAGLDRTVEVSALGSENILDQGERAAARSQARVHVGGSSILIGPWGGAESACGECLGIRWQRLRNRSEREALEGTSAITPIGNWPALPDLLLDVVWSLVQQTLLRPCSLRPSEWHSPADLDLPQVTLLQLGTLEHATYPLLPEPRCVVCSPQAPPSRDAAVLTFQPRAKKSPADFRTANAADFPIPTGALANPASGALGPGTWLDVTSPTNAPMAGSVFVRSHAGLSDITWSGQANAFGASKRLAFLEGLERYAGIHPRRPEATILKPYNEVAGHAMHPLALGHYTDGAYANDPEIDPFDPDRPIPWVWGYSIGREEPVLVPRRLVYYGSYLENDNFVFECSNGCASGGCVEEAALHAVLELIERDSFLLNWYGNAAMVEVDLTTSTRPGVRSMVDRLDLLGYDAHVFDSRIDLTIPAITALAVRRDGDLGTLCFAGGASLDPEAAIEAALSEVLCYTPHLPRQVRERRDTLTAMAADYNLVGKLDDHPRLFGLPSMRHHARSYEEPAELLSVQEAYGPGRAPTLGRDLRTDLMTCVDELGNAGLDVIIVDQTTPEQRRMGIHTVCAVSPGLLPIDFGWNRQRALQMPRLRTAFRGFEGRTAPLREDEIRRVPHPFP